MKKLLRSIKSKTWIRFTFVFTLMPWKLFFKGLLNESNFVLLFFLKVFIRTVLKNLLKRMLVLKIVQKCVHIKIDINLLKLNVKLLSL